MINQRCARVDAHRPHIWQYAPDGNVLYSVPADCPGERSVSGRFPSEPPMQRVPMPAPTRHEEFAREVAADPEAKQAALEAMGWKSIRHTEEKS